MSQFERSAKKRRLMTTPDFTGFKTDAVVSSPLEGTRPFFVLPKNYDARGIEKVEPKTEAEQAKQEQSFFSKYWMYILAALVILPRLFEAPPEGGQGGGQAPARS